MELTEFLRLVTDDWKDTNARVTFSMERNRPNLPEMIGMPTYEASRTLIIDIQRANGDEMVSSREYVNTLDIDRGPRSLTNAMLDRVWRRLANYLMLKQTAREQI